MNYGRIIALNIISHIMNYGRIIALNIISHIMKYGRIIATIYSLLTSATQTSAQALRFHNVVRVEMGSELRLTCEH